ncbi:hypothetical protein BDZ97DRAFT_1849023 [Flammula alnicola]|nr:hypothetical protein BDZ97DRAFT_1849023 [Flammula alnicola]
MTLNALKEEEKKERRYMHQECNLVNTGKSGNPGQTCMVSQRLGSNKPDILVEIKGWLVTCAASLRGLVPITARPWRIQRAFPCSGPQSELCTESKACFRLVSNILRTLSHHLSKHCGQTSVLQHLLRKTGVVEAIVMMASKGTEQMVEGDKDTSTCRCVEISTLEFQHI